MNNLLIPFARHESGRIVTAKEVERGSRSLCICLECGQDLIARQGDVLKWHFAHKGAGNVRGIGCGEGSIHRTAKEFLATKQGELLLLPKETKSGRKRVRISEGQEEVLISSTSRKVDVMLHCDGVKKGSDESVREIPTFQLAVEIHVTNLKDSEFVSDMVKADQRCIEIDIPKEEVGSRVDRGHSPKSCLTNMLLTAPRERIRWLSPPLPQCPTTDCPNTRLRDMNFCWPCILAKGTR